jgi:hypothetical protein
MTAAAVLVLILAAAPAAAQKKTDTVRLRFAWPVGLAAHVQVHKLRNRINAGTADSTNVRLAYQMLVQQHPRGRLIQLHSFEVPGVAELSNPDFGAEDFAELQERMSALMPTMVVDTAGAFVAIERVEAMQREMSALMGDSARYDPKLNPEAAALLDRLRSPQVLTTLAEYEWNALVGTWIEADLIVGLAYETEYELPFPLLPDVMLPVVQEFTAVGRVPCTEQETQRRCVELQSFVYQDQEALRAILDRVMSQVIPGKDVPKIEDFESETEIRLIAEPASLIPYHLTVTKRISASVRVGAGELSQTTQVETKTTQFRYSPPRR